MATKSDPTKDNGYKVDDDIGQEMIASTIENLKKEVEMYEKNLPEREKGRERFIQMWERDKRMYELMLENDNHKKISPDWNYELSDEYWDIRKSQLQDKFEQDKHMSEAKIEEFDVSIEAIKEELESSKKQLAELEEKMNKGE